MENKTKIIILVVLIIIFAGILTVKVFHKNGENENLEASEQIEEEKEEPKDEKKINIFSGTDRPMAFMIDNNVNAQPQSAINRAYAVYEIIVEGGETRLMALFKNVDISENDVSVGPIRSARHYFIDYAMENDAIYCHLGQSPQAENYVKNYNVTDINGQIYDTGKARTASSLFWREKKKSAPHNAYTSIASIKQICAQKNYTTTSKKGSVLNYVSDEVKFDEQNSRSANTVTIPYATNHTVKYVYNEETGRYTRYSKDKKQTDEETGEDVTTKNIIISFIKNTDLQDGENKGRQELDNITNASGYYITNGRVIDITCRKQYADGKTKYVDKTGKEIDVNDGNTWINICPINSKVTFE